MTDERELDLRDVPRSRRHPLVFAAYDELAVGESLLLANDHEPRRLRDEFESELPGSFAWETLGEGADGAWRVRVRRTTRAPLPRVVSDASALLRDLDPARGGSVWQLTPAGRDLDANIIALPPGDAIDTHDGPALDVLLFVISGGGILGTETGEITLAPGEVIWLPRRAQRRIDAGDDGLRYLSVHHRKPGLTISAAPPRAER